MENENTNIDENNQNEVDPRMDHYQLLLFWKAPEFINHERSFKWFLGAGTLVLMLIVYAIISGSATMAIAFVVLAGVYYITHNQEPKIVDIHVTDLGIYVDETFYPYNQINSFWIVYHPPVVQTLNLRLSGKAGQKVVIQLDRQNPAELKNVLSEYIPEIEGQGESTIDSFIRLLRL